MDLFQKNAFGFGFGPGASAADAPQSGLNWKYFMVGVVVAALIAVLVYFIIDKADTRPVMDGFEDKKEKTEDSSKKTYPIPPEGFKLAEGFADQTLYSAYKGLIPETNETMIELQQLDAKLAAFKRDLTSPAKTIDASKLVQYNTYQDIRPLADWTSQCFSKNVPERDIVIQMDRWLLSGKKTLADLNGAAGLPKEKNYDLLEAAVEDVKRVAIKECVATAHVDVQGLTGPHDPVGYGSAVTDTSAQFD
jgi:hypothetical protein